MKIRLEVELSPLARPLEGHGTDDEDKQDDEEGRHEDLAVFLDALADSLVDDPDGDEHEDGLVHDHLRGIGDEGAENVARLARSRVTHQAGEGPDEVLDGPAADDAVERQDHESGENSHPSDDGPCAAPELLEGTDRVQLGFPADGHFGKHDGETDNKDQCKVHENKGSSAILP